METQEVGAGDVDVCSMLLVDKTSRENEDVRRFVKEMRFVEVGETEDSQYDILQRAWAADTEEVKYEEEEDAEELVVFEETIYPEECLDADEDELFFGEHRGTTGTKMYYTTKEWSLEAIENLEHVGVESLHLDLKLMTQKSVDASTSFVWRDGHKEERTTQGYFTEIQVALSSVLVDLQPSTKEPSTKHVVHKIEIKFKPKESWAGDKQCIYMEVQPNEVRVLTQETAVQTTVGVMLSQTPGVQAGIGQSNASTVVEKQHEWTSELFRGTKAAAWVWSIGYWRDGRRFNLSNTDLRKLIGGGNISVELIRALAPNLVPEFSLQLNATDATATWAVDAQACHLDKFEFDVEITLHTAVFRLVNFLQGCVGCFRPKRASKYKFLHKGSLSI